MSEHSNKAENRILLHILKNNPANGEVYITWEGQTFKGQIQDIEVNRGVNILTTFRIKGVIRNEL